VVFGVLGLGMAAPFLKVAAAPALVIYLPRLGRWMIWLEHVLGLALLGTAAWSLSVLDLEAGAEAALAVGGILALLLAALASRQRGRPTAELARRSLNAVAIGLATLAVLVPPPRS
jgi:suppressor for copper-sensitivity B